MSLKNFCSDWYNNTARRDWNGVTVDDIRRDLADVTDAAEFDPQDVYDEMMRLVSEDDRINAAPETNPDMCLNMAISFEEFSSLIANGDSRKTPGVAVGYVLLVDDETECFYAEWAYSDIDNDCGEITREGWAEIERIDEEQSRLAYAAYLAGEREYVG